MSNQTHENFSSRAPAPPSSDRTFGFVFAGAFAFFGLLPLLRGKPVRLWCLALSAGFVLTALTVPVILHPLNRVWVRFGVLLGKITNPLLTGLMFFVVFTPVALILRLLGKDPLRLKFDRAAATYWIPRNPPGPLPETMRNQF